MKKILTLLIAFIIVFTGCSKKVTLKTEDAFNDYEDSGVITIFTDEDIDLNSFLKDTEKYNYTYNFSLSDSEDDLKLLEVPGEALSLDSLKEGEYTLTLRASLKDDDKTSVTMFKTYKLTTVDEELNLSNLDKDTDLDALLEKYGLKYEGSVDTSKAGVYSVKITKGDKTIGYKSIVVAKDELADASIVENETKNEVNNITEDKETANKDTSAGTSDSNTLDKSDSRIALAYSWEGMSGNCESIAFNYLQAIGYLQNFSYEKYLGYRYSDGFKKISSPSAFVTLIEYDNGAHVAVYLGNGMALQGNYSGKAKVTSMHLSGMSITAYYDMANTEKSSLVEEGDGSSNTSDSSSSNTNTATTENNGLGNYLYSENNDGLITDYYEYGYTTRYDESQSTSDDDWMDEKNRKVEEMAAQDHDPSRCYLIGDEWDRAWTASGGNSTDETLMEVEATITWCGRNGYEMKMD